MEETESSTLFESNNSCRIRRIPRLGNFDCANTIPQFTAIAFKQAHATPIRGESQARHRNFRDWSEPPARLFTPQQLLVRLVQYPISTISAGLEKSCVVYPFKLGQQQLLFTGRHPGSQVTYPGNRPSFKRKQSLVKESF